MIIVGAGVAGLAALDAVLDHDVTDVVVIEGGPSGLGPPPTVGFHPALDRRLAARLRTPADRPWSGVGLGGSGSVNGSVLHRPTSIEIAGDVRPEAIQPWIDRWWNEPRVSRPRADPVGRRLLDTGVVNRPIRLAIDPRTGRRHLPGVDRVDDPRVHRVVATAERIDHVDRRVIDTTGTTWSGDLVIVAAGAAATPVLLAGTRLIRRPGRRHLARVVDLTIDEPLAPVGWFTTSIGLPGGSALLGVTRTGPIAVVMLAEAVTVGGEAGRVGALDEATDALVELGAYAGVGVVDRRTKPGGVHHEAATAEWAVRHDGVVVVDPSTWVDLVDGPPMLTVAAVAAARVADALAGVTPTRHH